MGALRDGAEGRRMEATVTRWLGASREGMGRYKREVSAVIAREKRGRFAAIDEPRSAVR